MPPVSEVAFRLSTAPTENKVGEGGGGVDAQIVKAERGIDICRIHAGGVDARAQRAEVIAGDAAGVAIGGDAAAHRAVGDQPARLIAADDAAHGALTLHNAEKRAFLDRAVAASGNAADKFLRAARRDLPLDLERVDEGAALEREEKTGGESESVSVRPLMVCPPPLKVPLKLAMGSKSTPRREMSAVRRTVLPRDQAS